MQPEALIQTYDFLNAMRKAWAADDRPLQAHLDVTYRCDLDCGHCLLDNKTTWPEMTTAEWQNVLQQLHDSGVLFLVWSGGDVLMRRDFGELLQFAAKLGFFSRVKTHAGSLTLAWAQLLAANRVTRVDVSVFSLRAEIHDALTRRPGSLQNTLRGIQLVRDVGLPVKISTWVQPEIIDEIAQIHQHFTDLGCEVTFDTRTMLDHSATANLESRRLQGDLLLRARRAIEVVQQNARPIPIAQRATTDPCAAGRTLVYVSPDGELWPCINFPMPLGNLREKPLLDIWQTSAARKELVAWDNRDRTTCNSCAGSGFCNFCPGDAYKSTGDFRRAPGHFHAEARASMLAWEEVAGAPFSPEEWSSVPDEEGRIVASRKFVFPIHRPKRSSGARVRKITG